MHLTAKVWVRIGIVLSIIIVLGLFWMWNYMLGSGF